LADNQGVPPRSSIALIAIAAFIALASPAAADQTASPWPKLHRLLHLPRWKPGQPCPRTTGRHANEFSPYGTGYALGSGPVYPIITASGVDQTSPNQPIPYALAHPIGGWASFKTFWITSSTYSGPTLIRGQRLDGRPLLGFDNVLSRELRIPAHKGWNQGWRDWPSTTYVRRRGCYGYQVDGLTFSRVIVIQVR
jgi:hypothetical protein